jgi:hypothetical protein
VHLRRALLLFAIVLGLAAVAASVSRPGEESPPTAPTAPQAPETGRAPTVAPGTDTVGEPLAELTFLAGAGNRRRLQAGRPATLFVEVGEPGQVDLPDLGLTATAEPFTPARFEVLISQPGRYPILFTPASGDEQRRIGTLVVTDTGDG